jgi:hypothetical protein
VVAAAAGRKAAAVAGAAAAIASDSLTRFGVLPRAGQVRPVTVPALRTVPRRSTTRPVSNVGLERSLSRNGVRELTRGQALESTWTARAFSVGRRPPPRDPAPILTRL